MTKALDCSRAPTGRRASFLRPDPPPTQESIAYGKRDEGRRRPGGTKQGMSLVELVQHLMKTEKVGWSKAMEMAADRKKK